MSSSDAAVIDVIAGPLNQTKRKRSKEPQALRKEVASLKYRARLQEDVTTRMEEQFSVFLQTLWRVAKQLLRERAKAVRRFSGRARARAREAAPPSSEDAGSRAGAGAESRLRRRRRAMAATRCWAAWSGGATARKARKKLAWRSMASAVEMGHPDRPISSFTASAQSPQIQRPRCRSRTLEMYAGVHSSVSPQHSHRAHSTSETVPSPPPPQPPHPRHSSSSPFPPNRNPSDRGPEFRGRSLRDPSGSGHDAIRRGDSATAPSPIRRRSPLRRSPTPPQTPFSSSSSSSSSPPPRFASSSPISSQESRSRKRFLSSS
uniref:Uncharacterized protein n=1 Tax=Ananas comosus var. bracteatus TaxID=296719 RepID=A0A6V7P9C6_ANACO|nr:unnamed protein product [Ananas comosus var. bracteatus]